MSLFSSWRIGRNFGRWSGVAPLAHTFSQRSLYEYAFSNPIRYVDPSGMSTEETNDKEKGSEDKKDPDEPEVRGDYSRRQQLEYFVV